MLAQYLILLLLFLQPFLYTLSSSYNLVSDGDEVIWEQNRKLTWQDFQSEVDEQEPLHAMSSTNIAIKARCTGNLMQFEVKCVFVTKDSWSKNKLSERLLAHEQKHFDLTEVHARLIRRRLSETTNICSSGKINLSKVVEIYFDDWKAEQERYDQETNHGLNEEQQELWAGHIENRLKLLDQFAYLAKQ